MYADRNQEPEEAILLVDDDAGVLLALARLFAIQGLQPHTAGRVTRALAVLEEVPIDVIVSGLRMPGLSGLDFLEQLNADGKEIPFIMFTGHDDPAARVRALEAGA